MIGFGDYPETHEEGITLTPYVNEVIAWLQHCLDMLEAGTEDRILGDPFYVSNLTEQQIDAAIAEIDVYFDSEIARYPEYHERRSGANAKTELGRLGPAARRACVEMLQRIRIKHDQ